jgi:two-component system sensor histidine kinase DegS
MLEVDLEVMGQRCCWMSSQEVGHITQIAREALSNVVQHASASHVSVCLSYLGHATRLTISDDGQGIPADALDNGGHQSQGIANMQARARMLGGSLDLESRPGQGLHLVLTIPCDNGRVPRPEDEVRESWA